MATAMLLATTGIELSDYLPSERKRNARPIDLVVALKAKAELKRKLKAIKRVHPADYKHMEEYIQLKHNLSTL